MRKSLPLLSLTIAMFQNYLMALLVLLKMQDFHFYLNLQKTALTKVNDKNDILILTATSGDTGKAALEGFKDVDRTKIMVFYPNDGVSTVQKTQMQTQEGKNTKVCAIHGNFDDAQSGIKELFVDEEFKKELLSKNIKLSSANSINIGRLIPQVVYYVVSYLELVTTDKIKLGDKSKFRCTYW